jgi:hypothetical protein
MLLYGGKRGLVDLSKDRELRAESRSTESGASRGGLNITIDIALRVNVNVEHRPKSAMQVDAFRELRKVTAVR